MIKVNYTKSIPSTDYNEDGLYVNDPIYMAVDGATALDNSKKKPSEAALMVNYIIKNISSAYKKTHCFIDALYLMSENYYHNNYHKFKDIDNLAGLPSAGIAAVVEGKEYLNLYVLGDCEIVYLNRDMMPTRFSYFDQKHGLYKLDKDALKEMKTIAKKQNKNIVDTRKLINDRLIRNRNKLNKDSKYQVFIPSKKPTFKIKHKRIRKSTTKKLYIYTDGFAQAFDTLNIYKGYKDLFSRSVDMNSIIQNIINKWNSDKYFNHYPRFKKKDDLTIIELSIES